MGLAQVLAGVAASPPRCGERMSTPEAFFLPTCAEQRLCVHHAPSGHERAAALYVHPFAEEMNKSRRMAALGCRALARAGVRVLQIDLRGCGDSSADFGEVSWADWQADVRLGLDWLAARAPGIPLWLWGLRVGSLLTVADWGRPVNHLFWQPTVSGKPALQQFLRLKLAAEMASGASKGLMEQMKAELSAGRPVEIAGYSLGPALASGLEAARLVPAGMPGRIEWLELSTREDATFAPISDQAIKDWQAAGWSVRGQVVHGPTFWATSEIEIAPALIERTVEALS
ncbi:MAG: hydrolase 2, exosortase A system-associated [Rubrivivax sp.]|nr:MAG: hydrolase 2, exosortase A system-associated [Rubrivivax sp.]